MSERDERDERRAAAVPGVPVAARLRALADAPWSERGDAATQAALREGAAEVDAQRATSPCLRDGRRGR